MSPATIRIRELQAREWRNLGTQCRSTGRVLQVTSLAHVRRRPLVAVGVAALLGLAAFAMFRRGSKNEPLELREQRMARQHPPSNAQERNSASLLPEMLTKAVGAWIVHTFTQPPVSRGA